MVGGALPPQAPCRIATAARYAQPLYTSVLICNCTSSHLYSTLLTALVWSCVGS